MRRAERCPPAEAPRINNCARTPQPSRTSSRRPEFVRVPPDERPCWCYHTFTVRLRHQMNPVRSPESRPGATSLHLSSNSIRYTVPAQYDAPRKQDKMVCSPMRHPADWSRSIESSSRSLVCSHVKRPCCCHKVNGGSNRHVVNRTDGIADEFWHRCRSGNDDDLYDGCWIQHHGRRYNPA